MIRRRAEHDDGHVHIWLGDTPELADTPVCERVPGPPSPDQSGPPCMPCHLQHGEDLRTVVGDVDWRM